MTLRNPSATRSSACGQATRLSVPSARRSIGCSRRPRRPTVSPSAEPLEQSRPKFAGWAGSPVTAAPPEPSACASTPQPTPQYGQVVRTVGASGVEAFMLFHFAPLIPAAPTETPASPVLSSANAGAPQYSTALAHETDAHDYRVPAFAGTTRSFFSIHILLVAAVLLHLGHEGDRLVGRAYPEGRHDLDQRRLDVLGHALGVAADIDMRALGEPGPQIAANVAHAVLDIDFFGGVARPGEGEAGEHARRLHAGEL